MNLSPNVFAHISHLYLNKPMSLLDILYVYTKRRMISHQLIIHTKVSSLSKTQKAVSIPGMAVSLGLGVERELL